MDLDEYVWRRRVTLKTISKETGIHPNTLSLIRNLKITPSLDTALRLAAFTKGEVDYLEMLPTKVRKKVEKWLA